MTRPLRFRSKKQAAVYILRRRLVASLLEERPTCQRCQQARSTEVHELLSRARGGSILDVENCVALCHGCHSWITTHPAAATAEGWLRSRWSA
jgi:5-methylcytosine-specific restriction endonuclease McrA